MALSLVPRLPVLANAEHAFNSDEAVNALVIKHLLERGEFTLHNWDANYYGIVEGLLAIPFVAVVGFTPLAFKLSALVGFWLLVMATYLLGRRLFGATAGLMAAAMLATFSPQLVLWSTMASGGYTLIVAWGTFTLFYFAGLQRSSSAPRLRGLFAFGAILGFGLYIYELYLVYVALFALYAASASFPWRMLRAPSREGRRASWRQAPRQLGQLATVLCGVVVGWSPKLASVWSGASSGKNPLYQLATPEQVRANVDLLLSGSLPAFFGVNLTGSAEVARWVGAPWPLSTTCGWLLVASYAAFVLWGARRSLPRLAGVGRRPPAELDTEALMVLLVPLVTVAFIVSPNPQNLLASRYLLPWLSSLPLFAGALLVRVASRGRGPRWAAVAAASFLCVLPAVHIVRAHQVMRYLGRDLRLGDNPEPLVDVVRFLQQRGIAGAYGSYWTAYEATFLSGEEVVVAPFLDWDRYPPYTAQVRGLANVAYVFAQPRSAAEARFLEALERAGRSPEVYAIGPYRVYLAPDGRRLLPAGVLETPRPMVAPRATLVATEPVPSQVAPRAALLVPLRIVNDGTEWWYAGGVGAGTYRVAVSYHWFDERGTPSVFDGQRTVLPEDVSPGAALEITARVETPAKPGSYQLVLTLVQEGVAWFDQIGAGAARFDIEVRSAQPAPES